MGPVQILVNHTDWVECDDHLKLSSDEESCEDDGTLYAPLNNLQHKGSVVDMLMTGPIRTLKKSPEIAPIICVSAPSKHSRHKTRSNERAKKRRTGNGQQDGHQMNHHKNMSMATNHGSRYNINARNRNTQQIAGVLEEEEDLSTPAIENKRIRAGAYTSFKAKWTLH